MLCPLDTLLHDLADDHCLRDAALEGAAHTYVARGADVVAATLRAGLTPAGDGPLDDEARHRPVRERRAFA